MTFRERLHKGILMFDGAMGTQVQALNPTEEEWDGKTGCTEVLSLTVPDKVQKIHEGYLAVGSDAVETNTFGASEIVLSEFNLQHRTREINKISAEIARKAAEKYSTPEKPRFVIGSMGPGTKLVTLGHTDFDTMHHSYYQQALGLIDGKVDAVIIETCQDPLQIKAALLAVQDAEAEMGADIPKIVSVTVETTGTLLVGSSIQAVLATLAPYNIDVLGMNCATGPEAMRPYVKQICETFDGPVIVQPNAGLPKNIDGELRYTLPHEELADTLAGFITEYGVQVVGGCCGTDPDYLSVLHDRVKDLTPAERRPQLQPMAASLFSEVALEQSPRPFYIGERSNTNGSKLFREKLLAEDWDGIVDISKQQELTGAHGLDLCVAYTGRDEPRDMREAVTRVVKQVNLPIVIDSTDVDVLEQALKLIGGRAIINSINLEDGEDRADKICVLAKRFGAALIALTIDEQGMAKSVERKVEIAKRLYDIAVNRHGLEPQDLIFDTLTFTLGSGDESMKDAGIQTLDGIRQVKAALPGVYTVLGVSNISFGLSKDSREVLNSVFMDEAVQAGLDFAIVNVKKIMPLARISQDDIDICLNLIYNRGTDPLHKYIDHFAEKEGTAVEEETLDESAPLSERIQQRIIQGNRSGLEEMLMEQLGSMSAVDIINTLLIPGMKVVGDLFGDGKMQLPFVLQSAEVMKFAVGILEPYMEKVDSQAQKSIVLATVRGDVHDIGKNLVDIILSNNGYKVYNLGIKCEIDTMLNKAQEVNADVIGMSGLLVKSTAVMKENLEVMQQRNVKIPVLLGGAALTKSYVDDICDPVLDTPVLYCADAFEGLKAMGMIKAGTLDEYAAASREKGKKRTVRPKPKADEKVTPISRDINIPEPPFWGDKVVTDIDLDTVYSYLTESVIFRGRWGYRRGKLPREEYEELLEKQVRPEFEALKRRGKEEGLFDPKLVYGYYPCNSEGDEVIIYHPDSDEERLRLHYPRQRKAPHRSIADFFLPVDSGKRDIIAMQVVTVGHKSSEYSQKLYEQDAYKDYLLFHGLSVETAEALAEYWHQQVRIELNITEEDGAGINDFVVQKYRGSRYSYGYPACPDLSENRKMFTLLQPERIKVTLTEEDQMNPEQTTSAFIVHHPQAKYFTLD